MSSGPSRGLALEIISLVTRLRKVKSRFARPCIMCGARQGLFEMMPRQAIPVSAVRIPPRSSAMMSRKRRWTTRLSFLAPQSSVTVTVDRTSCAGLAPIDLLRRQVASSGGESARSSRLMLSNEQRWQQVNRSAFESSETLHLDQILSRIWQCLLGIQRRSLSLLVLQRRFGDQVEGLCAGRQFGYIQSWAC